jgi:hypothetical protein
MNYVKFLGKVDREELVKEQRSAEVMAYPSTYEECFCIAAMECIAAGAVPVTTKLAALETTVADSGVLLSNSPGNSDYDKQFVDSVSKLLTDPALRKDLQERGRLRATNYSWEKIGQLWAELFENCVKDLKKPYMVKCKYCESEFKNSYLRNKHVIVDHESDKLAEMATNPAIEPISLPTEMVMRFSVPVEIYINGHAFIGKDIKVPYEYIDGVTQTACEVYGPDVII